MRIGIDIIHSARFKGKSSTFFEKYFTEAEIEYAKKRPNFENTIAGMFAVKEAFLKAIGIGVFKGISLNEVEIGHTKKGKPELKLSKQVKKLYKIKKCDISISHDANICQAVCVLN